MGWRGNDQSYQACRNRKRWFFRRETRCWADRQRLLVGGIRQHGTSTIADTASVAIVMPKGTPSSIVTKVNLEVNKLLAMPEVREAILTQGAEPQSMSVANFDKMFQADFKQSKQIVESSGAKIE